MKKLFSQRVTLQAFFGLALMVILASACTKDITLGNGLFAGDQLNVKYIDTLSFNLLTEKVDSVLSYNYSSSSQPTNHFLGNIEDPTFGRTEASIYTQLTLASAVLPNFVGARLDSAVLSVGISADTTVYYGNWANSDLNFDIFRVTEDIPTMSLIYSNKTFATATTSLVSVSVRPDPTVTAPTIADSTQKLPYFSVRLDSTVVRTLMDTSYYASTDSFVSKFKGLCFRGRGTQSALWALNLSNQYSSRLLLYYKDSTGAAQRLDFRIGNGVRYNAYKHDYTTSIVKPYIGDLRRGDSLMFVQGMSGVNARIEVPYVRELAKEKIAINKAEIEFTVKQVGSPTFFGPMPQLLFYKRASDGTLTAIDDVTIASSQGSISTYFGGDLKTDVVNGATYYRYRMAITVELQKMITGERGSVLYIVPAVKAQTVRNVTIFGAKSPLYRPKLKITYTKL